MTEIRIPNLEGGQDMGIVEIYVRVGDVVKKETPLISLESDKAVMDVPSPLAGTITEIKVSEGDSVNSGDLIALVDSDDSDLKSEKAFKGNAIASETRLEEGATEQGTPLEGPPPSAISETTLEPRKIPVADMNPEDVNTQAMRAKYHATPSIRALARELGVSLAQVSGTGPKGRITREDLSSLVKRVMSGTSNFTKAAEGFTLPPIPSANYSALGEIEAGELSRIKKISGPNLHRNWIGIPHVTQFEKADITELEVFRKELNAEIAKDREIKISPLIFIIKATVQALKDFPDFNSSLSSDGRQIIRKKYINIGVAVDTQGGLLVPVIKNADSLNILRLAEKLANLSQRAREGKLKADEMSGGTFTISSLGGIGGTNFTPIINAPEVAILGVSKSEMKPVWNGSSFDARLILPFSLSYDHRIIDGASAARFTKHLSGLIGDIRRVLL